MSKQSLLDFLICRTSTYEKIDELSLTGGGGDFQMLFSPVCERPIFHTGYDVFGVHWTQAKPTSHYTPGQEPVIKDIEDWREQVRFPVVDRFDWGYVAEQAKHLDRESKVITCTLAIGPFERASSLTTFEDCLVNAISESEDFAELIGAVVDYKIDIVRHLHQHACPDFINLHDDWGTSTSTFFSPELWRETIKPHTKRLYDAIHDLGMLVGQHSCGRIEAIVGDMVEIGCNAWEAQENCNDIPLLREQYGDKLCIIAPPPPKGDELGENESEDASAAPDPAILPMNYRPYVDAPAFLYA